MSYVQPRVRSAGRAAKVLGGSLVPPSDDRPSAWIWPEAPLPPGPFALFPDKGIKLEKGVAWANAIHMSGGLIVRKSLAAPVLAPLVAAGELELRPVLVVKAYARTKLPWNSDVLDDDFVFLNVRARMPVDRALLPPESFIDDEDVPGRGGPYGSLVHYVPDDVRFSPGREPRFSIFRIGEQPSLLFLDKDVFGKLDKALGGVLEIGESGPTFHILDAYTTPPLSESPAIAEAAALAFYRMYKKGAAISKDVELARQSPIWAYWTACFFPSTATDESRRAASKHPFYAYAYARDVDHGPHPVTRAGAAKDVCACKEYVIHIDHQTEAITRKKLQYDDSVGVDVKAHANGRRFDASVEQPWHPLIAASAPTTAPKYVQLVPAYKGIQTGSIRTPGYTLYAPWQRRMPGALRFIADKKVLAKQSRIKLLVDGAYGPLIVRKSAIADIWDIPAEDATLVPVILWDAKGPVDDDFALIDVHAHWPLDTESSKVSFVDDKRPTAAGVRLVHSFDWSEERAPQSRIFALVDFPRLIVVEEALARAIEKATNGALTISTKPPTAASQADALDRPERPTQKDETSAKAAMKAFWRLSKDDKQRRAALSSPIGALTVAMSQDRKPKADTRKAALTKPETALAYARYIEKKPSKDTRAAVKSHGPSARAYAHDIDIGIHPSLQEAFAQWDKTALANYVKELAETRKDLE